MDRDTSKPIGEKAPKWQSKGRVKRLLEKISFQTQSAVKGGKTGKRKYPVEITNWFIY